MFEQVAAYPTAIADDGDAGIAAAIQWSIDHVDGDTLTVWTYTKGNLENSAELSNLVSRYRGIAHVTGRGRTFLHSRGPVLMAWPEMEDIGEIARSTNRITALCIIAWDRDGLSPWVAASKPTILGDPQVWETDSKGLDPVVEEALEGITRGINHNNTISAGYEKDRAVSVLLALRSAGYRPDPGEVQGWALAHGWTGKNPQRLADYVRDINGGKTPRARSVLRDDYIAALRQRVDERDSS